MEYLPPGTIIVISEPSVEHLYDKGDVIGPPGGETEVSFDVDVTDWAKYRLFEEITTGVYYDCAEPSEMGSDNEKRHKRTYEVVFAAPTADIYRGPWYAHDDEFTNLCSFYSERVWPVAVAVDFFDETDPIYEYEDEQKRKPFTGEYGRAVNRAYTAGSYYGIPWNQYESIPPPHYEWENGWRNLREGGKVYPPVEEYSELNADFYLRFYGACEMRNLNGDVYYGGTNPEVDPGLYYEGMQAPGAGGKAWFDNAVFAQTTQYGEYLPPDFLPTGAQGENPGFEDGTNKWYFGDSDNVKRELSSIAYEDDYSAKLKRYDTPNPLTYVKLKHYKLEDIDDKDGFDPRESARFEIGGRIRTKLADTLPMMAPWQWFVCARELEKGEESYDPDDADGRVLGPVNEMMTNHPLPSTDPTSFNWKEHVSDISASEWGWTSRKPMIYDDPDTEDEKDREDVWKTPLLKNFWYRPVFVFEAETVRHEKKAEID
jgi:hypothetical protein